MTGSSRRAAALGAAVLAAAAVLLALLPSCDGRQPATGEGAAGTGPERAYSVRMVGPREDWPWNSTLFLDAASRPAEAGPLPMVFFDDEPEFKVTAREGDAWRIRSELTPTPAMERIFWRVDQRGTFGAGREIDVRLPPRARVVVTGEETTSGTDHLTFVDESSSARLVVARDPGRGLRYAVFDERSWLDHVFQAPPRPWSWNETRPGKFAVAARVAGRQWVAVRAELRDGEELVLDAFGRPEGGGTVVSEDPTAEILLDGDVPIPPLRLAQEHYRSRWEGVPPGRHALRYGKDDVVPFTVEEGREVVIPRRPPR
jgi:hypothetical protein